MIAAELQAQLRAEHPNAAIARVEIDESSDELPVIKIFTGRPGILIGQRGATVEALKNQLDQELGPIKLNIVEVARSELEPLLVADTVLLNLVRGVDLERTLAKNVKLAIRAGARGCRIELSGALGEHLASDGELDTDALHEATETATAEAGELTCRVQIAPGEDG